MWDEIRRAGYEKSLNSGIVLTGGGAILEGMPEIAEQIFDLPIRRGTPVGVGGLADHINSPVFATPVGIGLYRASQSRARAIARGRGRIQPRRRAAARDFQGLSEVGPPEGRRPTNGTTEEHMKEARGGTGATLKHCG